ncbi:hypothetical protein [[Clostridium] symbiosum]|jgi:hypothetical protein|uniref:hypothetical protein n=1 Tax=Clostridium symbiosum TaxID=1512 RepID=UPI00321C24FA
MDVTVPICINGYDTYLIKGSNDIGDYLFIAIPPNAGKDISDICGSSINGHLITQIDYKVIDGTRYIKAYY